MALYAMTGGATGIGAAIKYSLLDAGHKVVVVDIKDAEIEADLSSKQGRDQAIAALREACADGLDGFVACAGVGSHVPNKQLIASVNYYGAIELVEGMRELLAQKGGSAVLISSNSAPMKTDDDFVTTLLEGDEDAALITADAMPGQMVYSGSKQAVARWVRRNAAEYARQGIRLNALAPGYTQTPMTAQVENDPTYGEAIKKFMDSIPVGRPGQPEDMAKATKFLLGPDSSFICGIVLFVDGGHDAMMRADTF